MLYVLLKALPPVCMKYTGRDESQVANIAGGKGEAECYICHKTLIKSSILSYKQSGSVLSILHLLKCHQIQFFGHFNTFINKKFPLINVSMI